MKGDWDIRKVREDLEEKNTRVSTFTVIVGDQRVAHCLLSLEEEGVQSGGGEVFIRYLSTVCDFFEFGQKKER